MRPPRRAPQHRRRTTRSRRRWDAENRCRDPRGRPAERRGAVCPAESSRSRPLRRSQLCDTGCPSATDRTSIGYQPRSGRRAALGISPSYPLRSTPDRCARRLAGRGEPAGSSSIACADRRCVRRCSKSPSEDSDRTRGRTSAWTTSYSAGIADSTSRRLAPRGHQNSPGAAGRIQSARSCRSRPGRRSRPPRRRGGRRAAPRAAPHRRRREASSPRERRSPVRV